MFSSERKFVMAAGWCFVVLGGWALLLPLARAEEKKQQSHVRVEVKANTNPILAKIPYVSRLFVNPQEATEDCERIGVDFECPGGLICPIGKLGQYHIICVTHQGDACPAECTANQTAQKCAPCASGECPACADVAKACCADVAKACCADVAKACCADQAKTCCAEAAKLCCDQLKVCGEAQGQTYAEISPYVKTAKRAEFVVRQCSACEQGESESQKMIAELRIQNAILESKLSAQNEIFKARVELMEQWAKLVAEKSKIEAELAFVQKLAAEREEVCRQTLELKTEKNELEGFVRAAEDRRAIEIERIELAGENEKLKKRVAELEQQIGSRATGVVR